MVTTSDVLIATAAVLDDLAADILHLVPHDDEPMGLGSIAQSIRSQASEIRVWVDAHREDD